MTLLSLPSSVLTIVGAVYVTLGMCEYHQMVSYVELIGNTCVSSLYIFCDCIRRCYLPSSISLCIPDSALCICVMLMSWLHCSSLILFNSQNCLIGDGRAKGEYGFSKVQASIGNRAFPAACLSMRRAGDRSITFWISSEIVGHRTVENFHSENHAGANLRSPRQRRLAVLFPHAQQAVVMRWVMCISDVNYFINDVLKWDR